MSYPNPNPTSIPKVHFLWSLSLVLVNHGLLGIPQRHNQLEHKYPPTLGIPRANATEAYFVSIMKTKLLYWNYCFYPKNILKWCLKEELSYLNISKDLKDFLIWITSEGAGAALSVSWCLADVRLIFGWCMADAWLMYGWCWLMYGWCLADVWLMFDWCLAVYYQHIR